MFLKGKNRFVTVLFYLSDVAAGGETSFPFAGALLLRRSRSTQRTAQRTYALPTACNIRTCSSPVVCGGATPSSTDQ